jgi:CHAD domain
MVSSLDPRQDLAEGLRAAVHECLRAAHEALNADSGVSAVHDARKLCKRARAALDLVGGRSAREVGRSIADGARLLSAVRDADVLARLVKDHGWAIEVPAPSNREELCQRAAEALARASLAAEKIRYERAEAPHLDRRLVRSWKLARRAMWASVEARQRDGSTDVHETFHQWRRRVKRLQVQCLLLADVRPVLASSAEGLDSLQEVLGTLHDLAVLREVAPSDQPDLDDEIALYVHRAISEGRTVLALRASELAASLQSHE